MIIFFDAFPIILVAIFAVIVILAGIISGVESTTIFLQNNLSTIIILLMLIFLIVSLIIELVVRQRKLLAVVHSPIDVFCTLPPLLLFLIEIAYVSEASGNSLQKIWNMMEFILGLVVSVLLYAVFIAIVLAIKFVICIVCKFISETMFKEKSIITDVIELAFMFLLAFLVSKFYIKCIQWSYSIEEVEIYPSYISNVLSWMLAK